MPPRKRHVSDGPRILRRSVRLRKPCPIAKLPDELLSMLFTIGANDDTLVRCSCPEWSSCPRSRTRRNRPFQEVMARVCWRWRAVALRTATLWNTIEMGPFVPRHRLARDWLERSKPAPLDVTLDMLDDSSDFLPIPPQPSLLEGMMNALCKHLDRWRTFIVFANSHSELDYVLRVLSNCAAAPSLRTLALYNDGERRASPALQPVLFHGICPLLRSITISGLTGNWYTLLPYSKLTLLDIRGFRGPGPTFDQFATLVATSPELQTLRLHGAAPANPGAWPLATEDRVLSCPALRTIMFGRMKPSIATKLIRYVSAPALKVLELDLSVDLDTEDHSALLAAIANPPMFPALDQLRVVNAFASGDSFKTLLRTVPGLTKLEIEVRLDNLDWLSCLAAPSTGVPPLVPQLERLSIISPECGVICHMDDEPCMLDDILESRREAGHDVRDVQRKPQCFFEFADFMMATLMPF